MFMKICIVLFLLGLHSVAFSQDVTTKFANDVCACLKGIKLETYTSSTMLSKEVGTCFVNSATTHQKELKKKKVVDLDKATNEQITDLWTYVWKQCQEVGQAAFSRRAELEDAEADLSFQGIITYTQDFVIGGAFKNMGITKEMLMQEMNKEGKWFDTLWVNYRLGNYAQFGNDAAQTAKIYHASDNIIYTFQLSGDDLCSVQEAVDLTLDGKADKPVVTVVDSAVTIMGLPCKIIRMKWRLGQLDYYYNESQARINPELFAKHTSDGLAEFLKISGSLPLQIVKSVMGMDIVQTAVNIEQGRVDKNAFEVPELVEDASLNVIKMPGITIMRVKK